METTSGFTQLVWILGAAGVLGGIYSSAIERFWLDVCSVPVPLKQLPRAFSGFRIALLSDIHLGFFYGPKDLSVIVEVINGLGPDVICIAGDSLESNTSLGVLDQAVPILSRLKAPFGKFAVLGNHDCKAGVKGVIRGFERGGFFVLRNDHAVLKKDNDRLFLIGLDDVLEGKADLQRAIEGIPETECKILLVHEPDFADYTSRFPVDLQLSGHSHGGQVRFPFLGPLVTTRLGRKYPSGLRRVGKLMLYTNRGLGTTLLPLRFLCRPEITIITLETKLSLNG